MQSMQQFYLDRAADAGRSAAAAPLVNVRERHLLAELTWNGLADRAARVATLHAERVAGARTAALPIQELR